jgi:hypothetical protein
MICSCLSNNTHSSFLTIHPRVLNPWLDLTFSLRQCLEAAAAASFFWHIADGMKKIMNCEALARLCAIAEGHE